MAPEHSSESIIKRLRLSNSRFYRDLIENSYAQEPSFLGGPVALTHLLVVSASCRLNSSIKSSTTSIPKHYSAFHAPELEPGVLSRLYQHTKVSLCMHVPL